MSPTALRPQWRNAQVKVILSRIWRTELLRWPLLGVFKHLQRGFIRCGGRSDSSGWTRSCSNAVSPECVFHDADGWESCAVGD